MSYKSDGCSEYKNKKGGKAMTFSKKEVLDIATLQGRLCAVFFAVIIINILVRALFFYLHEDSVLLATVGMFIPIIQIFFAIWLCVVVYQLAKALKRIAWPYILGVFVPLVNLIIFGILVVSASKVLKANNIAVGVMGAKKQSLENYIKTHPEETIEK